MINAGDVKVSGDNPPSQGLAVSLLITLALLAAIRLLHHIPIAGVAEFAGQNPTSDMARFSIAAVAIPAWLTVALLTQLFVMIAPAKWTHRVTRNGYINPFCFVVLLLTAALALSQASGIAVAFDSMIEPANSQNFQLLATASLVAGTGAIIACAWLVERFGLGLGFWIVLAMQSIMDAATWASQRFMMAEIGVLAPIQIAMGLAALVIATFPIVLITLHVIKSGGQLELVAWPLPLANIASIVVMLPFLGLFNAGPDTKGMPENIPAYLAGSLLTLAIIVFFMTRRDGMLRLFVPMLGIFALIELASYGALHVHPDYNVVLPLPTGGFVTMIVVLTVLVQRHWRERLSKSNDDSVG